MKRKAAVLIATLALAVGAAAQTSSSTPGTATGSGQSSSGSAPGSIGNGGTGAENATVPPTTTPGTDRRGSFNSERDQGLHRGFDKNAKHWGYDTNSPSRGRNSGSSAP